MARATRIPSAIGEMVRKVDAFGAVEIDVSFGLELFSACIFVLLQVPLVRTWMEVLPLWIDVFREAEEPPAASLRAHMLIC